MKFEEIGIQGKTVLFSDLESVMRTLEIIRGGQWDYERVTYDHKFENRNTGDIYYLRVPGVAVKGEIEQPDAEIELMTPILGHYYYPHGVEYDEEFPTPLVQKCKEKLNQLKELLEEVELAKTESVKTKDVIQILLQVPGVANVGNLHIWKDDAGESKLSCHLIIHADSDHETVLHQASEILKNDLEIEHSTIQIDRETPAPAGSES